MSISEQGSHYNPEDARRIKEMLTEGSKEGERLWAAWQQYILDTACPKDLSIVEREDLIQEAYIQTEKALKSFRFDCRLETYYFSIFINCYRQWLRKKQSQEKHSKRIDDEISNCQDLSQNSSEYQSPEELLIKQERDAEIRRFVEEEIRKIVGDLNFQILYWYYIEQTYVDEESGKKEKCTDKAIATRLKMSTNTVTARRHRAIRKIQQYLRNNPHLLRKLIELLGLGHK